MYKQELNPLTNDFNMVVDESDFIKQHQGIENDGVVGVRNAARNTNTINRFAVCSTGASTAAKTATILSGNITALSQGLKVTVKFANANTADNPTLAVNSLAAANIYVNGAQITTGDNKGLLCGVCEFVYDGTNWNLIGSQPDIDVSMMTEVTYAELWNLRNDGLLEPGAWYRITDYNTAVYSESNAFRAAGHQFDVLVRADDSTTINENAYAIQHKWYNGAIDYFGYSHLGGWELKYRMDKDDTDYQWVIFDADFSWANAIRCPMEALPAAYRTRAALASDTWGFFLDANESEALVFKFSDDDGTTLDDGLAITMPLDTDTLMSQTVLEIDGVKSSVVKYYIDGYGWCDVFKGFIYHMKDEHGNEAPYDFKNILFRRDKITQVTDGDGQPANNLGGAYAAWDGFDLGYIPDLNFDVDSEDSNYYYTFSYNENDATTYPNMQAKVNGNTILSDSSGGQHQLPNIVVLLSDFLENTRFKGNNLHIDKIFGSCDVDMSNAIIIYCNDIQVKGTSALILGCSSVKVASGCENLCLGTDRISQTLSLISIGSNSHEVTVSQGADISLGEECSDITLHQAIHVQIDAHCSEVIIEDGTDIVIGQSSVAAIGSDCFGIRCGSECGLTIGDHCNGISLGDNNNTVTIGDNCGRISLGDNNEYIAIYDNCGRISLGDNNEHIAIYDNCGDISCGSFDANIYIYEPSNALTISSEVHNVIIESTNSQTIPNALVLPDNYNNSTITFDDTEYRLQVAGITSNGDIKIWNPADLVP